MFDRLKGLLDADKPHMQCDIALEGWAFLNHISLLLLYIIYNKLKVAGMLKKWSVHNLIEELRYVRKYRINGKWETGEATGKTRELIQILENSYYA